MNIFILTNINNAQYCGPNYSLLFPTARRYMTHHNTRVVRAGICSRAAYGTSLLFLPTKTLRNGGKKWGSASCPRTCFVSAPSCSYSETWNGIQWRWEGPGCGARRGAGTQQDFGEARPALAQASSHMSDIVVSVQAQSQDWREATASNSHLRRTVLLGSNSKYFESIYCAQDQATNCKIQDQI